MIVIPIAISIGWWVLGPARSSGASIASGGSITKRGRSAYERLLFQPARKAVPLATANKALLFGTAIGRLRDFLVTDNHVMAVEGTPGRHLLVADLSSESPKVMESPLQVFDPTSISLGVGRNDRGAWVYDFRSGAFNKYSLAGKKASQAIQLPSMLFQPVWIDTRIIANGLFPDTLVRVFGVDGAILNSWGRTPFPDVLPEIAIHLNRSSMALQPTRQRLVLSFLYSSRLEIMATNGSAIASISGPVEVRLEYRTASDPTEGIQRFLRTDETEYAYIDVATDEEAIYALFSGRSRGKWGEAASLATEVHVFSWTGQLLTRVRLADPAYAISVDSVRRKVYVIVPGPPQTMEELELPRP
jgi:hypothetical protein